MSVIPKPFQEYKAKAPFRSERNRVLSQWRGIDLEPQEVARKNTGRTPSQIMPAILSKFRMDKRQSEAEIVNVWNESIDPQITAHAQPTGLNKGTLFVTVDSSPWLDEIVRYRRKEILTRLQHSFGKELVVKISFRLG
jgi:hypothetical protein